MYMGARMGVGASVGARPPPPPSLKKFLRWGWFFSSWGGGGAAIFSMLVAVFLLVVFFSMWGSLFYFVCLLGACKNFCGRPFVCMCNILWPTKLQTSQANSNTIITCSMSFSLVLTVGRPWRANHHIIEHLYIISWSYCYIYDCIT